MPFYYFYTSNVTTQSSFTAKHETHGHDVLRFHTSDWRSSDHRCLILKAKTEKKVCHWNKRVHVGGGRDESGQMCWTLELQLPVSEQSAAADEGARDTALLTTPSTSKPAASGSLIKPTSNPRAQTGLIKTDASLDAPHANNPPPRRKKHTRQNLKAKTGRGNQGRANIKRRRRRRRRRELSREKTRGYLTQESRRWRGDTYWSQRQEKEALLIHSALLAFRRRPWEPSPRRSASTKILVPSSHWSRLEVIDWSEADLDKPTRLMCPWCFPVIPLQHLAK